MTKELNLDTSSYEVVSQRLQALHDRVVELDPGIVRIACALYDAPTGMLKTFINSTHDGHAIRGYQYRLADSESLSYLARTRELRLLTDIQSTMPATTAHAKYVLDEGYESSFTVPMFHEGEFFGFIFFDSRQRDTFSSHVQRELLLYSSIITMAVASELIAIRAVIAALQIARDFTAIRDVETGLHATRMAQVTRVLCAQLMDELDLGDECIEHICLYAPLHDIGKIAIPDRILLKPGPLDDDEWEIMKSHTTRGRAMVDQIVADLQLGDLPDGQVLRNIVELHHEKLDGSGYPFGLIGDAIPFECRVISVADMFDALTSARPNKDPWLVQHALEALQTEARQGRLDPCVVDALVSAHRAGALNDLDSDTTDG